MRPLFYAVLVFTMSVGLIKCDKNESVNEYIQESLDLYDCGETFEECRDNILPRLKQVISVLLSESGDGVTVSRDLHYLSVSPTSAGLLPLTYISSSSQLKILGPFLMLVAAEGRRDSIQQLLQDKNKLQLAVKLNKLVIDSAGFQLHVENSEFNQYRVTITSSSTNVNLDATLFNRNKQVTPLKINAVAGRPSVNIDGELFVSDGKIKLKSCTSKINYVSAKLKTSFGEIRQPVGMDSIQRSLGAMLCDKMTILLDRVMNDQAMLEKAKQLFKSKMNN